MAETKGTVGGGAAEKKPGRKGVAGRSTASRAALGGRLGSGETQRLPLPGPGQGQAPALAGSGGKDTRPAPDRRDVRVASALLDEVRQRSGFGSDEEAVEFALSLLAGADPAAEFLRERRGTLPGHDLDT